MQRTWRSRHQYPQKAHGLAWAPWPWPLALTHTWHWHVRSAVKQWRQALHAHVWQQFAQTVALHGDSQWNSAWQVGV